MKFSLTNLFVGTSMVALLAAILYGDPLFSLGLAVILLPTVGGLIIATLFAKHARPTRNNKEQH